MQRSLSRGVSTRIRRGIWCRIIRSRGGYACSGGAEGPELLDRNHLPNPQGPPFCCEFFVIPYNKSMLPASKSLNLNHNVSCCYLLESSLPLQGKMLERIRSVSTLAGLLFATGEPVCESDQQQTCHITVLTGKN